MNEIAENLTLILTASINPNGMPGVSRPDPHAREQDYIDCLRYYATSLSFISRIVFVENSAWSLERIQGEIAGLGTRKEIEYLSLGANDYPRELGKGYGEMLMLDHAMSRSALVQKSTFAAKLTGRNYLRNLERLLSKVDRDFGLLCDLRDHPLYEWVGSRACGRHSDTRFLAFRPEFYRDHIAGTYERLTSDYVIEGLFYDIAKDPALRESVIPRFPIEPDFAGLSGHLLADGSARDYSSGVEKMKRRARALSRLLAPWLHI